MMFLSMTRTTLTDKKRALMKQADADNLAYEMSKIKLYGVISLMTTQKVDEKLSVHRSTIKPNPILSAGSSTAAAITTHSIDAAIVNCPLPFGRILCMWSLRKLLATRG
jgi:hypothetical protein